MKTKNNAHLFDKVYSSAEMYYGWDVRPEFNSFVETINFRNHSSLDLGCGDGRYSIYLACRGSNVTAVDFSQVAITKILNYAQNNYLTINTKCIDLNLYSFPKETYDLVVFPTILDHLDFVGRKKVVKGILDSLKPGGFFYGNVFTKKDHGYAGQKNKSIDRKKISETSWAIKHYFSENELISYFNGNNVIDYKEFTEEDYSHGPVHIHGWAYILGRKN